MAQLLGLSAEQVNGILRPLFPKERWWEAGE